MPRKLLTVELPVCDRCGRVGKVPAAQFAGKDMCTGPANAPHSKVRTKKVRFQEVAGSKESA
jgi:hypothetical protein